MVTTARKILLKLTKSSLPSDDLFDSSSLSSAVQQRGAESKGPLQKCVPFWTNNVTGRGAMGLGAIAWSTFFSPVFFPLSDGLSSRLCTSYCESEMNFNTGGAPAFQCRCHHSYIYGCPWCFAAHGRRIHLQPCQVPKGSLDSTWVKHSGSRNKTHIRIRQLLAKVIFPWLRYKVWQPWIVILGAVGEVATSRTRL
mmetsp:Transcript_26707/g.82154  ORF Transcript_26707/g.82154 Transcript_26707/m.82154 type:complete len:196 (+) Transcript_26707:604-1191(+)